MCPGKTRPDGSIGTGHRAGSGSYPSSNHPTSQCRVSPHQAKPNQARSHQAKPSQATPKPATRRPRAAASLLPNPMPLTISPSDRMPRITRTSAPRSFALEHPTGTRASREPQERSSAAAQERRSAGAQQRSSDQERTPGRAQHLASLHPTGHAASDHGENPTSTLSRNSLSACRQGLRRMLGLPPSHRSPRECPSGREHRPHFKRKLRQHS